MRMYHKLLTRFLCDQHLLGAHFELHKHRHSFVKKYSITGRIFPEVQIEPSRMKKYHNELVKEMVRRGMRHHSPYRLPDLQYLPKKERTAKIELAISLRKLKSCTNCLNRWRND